MTMANSYIALCPALSTVTRRRASYPLNLLFLQANHASSYSTTQAYSDQASSSTLLTSQAPIKPQSEISRIRECLVSREKTAVGIAEDYLSKLKDREPKIKSFLYISEHALQEAEKLDKMIAANASLGPLAGVPFGIKDNLCTIDMPSTGGSKILESYRPPFDATSVRRMKEAGALPIGKTNLDEFGMGSTTESSAFQVTSNPWDMSRVPGGSSGGSASAVAARQCTCALGSDTGGSIRQPASFCGVVGLKPTYGRVSRYGLMAFASSLDVVGCFGTSVMDAGILLEVIAGHDKLDATSSLLPVPQYSTLLPNMENLNSKPLVGLRVGVIKETIGDGVDSGVSLCITKAADHLEALGATIREVSLPSFSLGLPAYYILACSEASSNLARYDGVRYGSQTAANDLVSMYAKTRSQGFGEEVKRRILMGTYTLSAGYYDAFYKRAQQIRAIIQTDFKKALADNDLLMSPAAPTPAYSIGEKVNVNLAGLPALVVPCGFAGEDHRLPVGLQFIGNAFDEGNMLRVGHIFEQTLQKCFVPPMVI